MTNQVNQAFEKWAVSQKDENNLPYFIVKLANDKYADGLTTHAWNGWQAATKASESEINSLKEQVKELQSHLSSQSIELAKNDVTLESYAHKVAELQVDNKIMRDTLNKIALGHVYDADIIESAGDCLQRLSTTQSLAAHDNEVLSKVISLLEDMNANGKHTLPDYIAAICAMKVTP